MRVRQPLQKILLPVLDEAFKDQVEGIKDLVLAEVNIKEIEYVTDTTGILKKKIKPNFKTLGRRLGKNMKAAAQIIGQMDQQDIAQIEKTNSYTLSINGDTYELTAEDFEITTDDIPGWQVANDGPLTVALDVTVTEELLAEGMARELVNRIQNIRKDKDFNVTDNISIKLERHEEVTPAVEQFGDYVKTETLATHLELVDALPDGEELELPDDVKIKIQVEQI